MMADRSDSWEGEKIILKETKELDDFLNEGYEIVDRDFNLRGQKNEDGGFETFIKSRLLLKKDTSLLNADVNELGLYSMQFEWLYDFEKKRPVCTFMSDQSVHSELEGIIVDLIAPRFRKPFLTTSLELKNQAQIYHILKEFVKSEKNLRYVGFPKLFLSDIFSQVLIIHEVDEKVNFEIISKEKITLDEIQQMKIKAKEYDNCIGLSFFILTKKISKKHDFNDSLVGIILNDIKNEKTICFSIVSKSYFYQSHVKNVREGNYDVALSLFEECVNKNMELKSFLPVTVDHPWYTPLPWIYYAVLLPLELDEDVSEISKEKIISIQDYFLFGIPKWPATKDSFVFEHFSSFKEGRATCLYDFNSKNKITYPLRFDQSKGEPLVHLDFAFYDGKQNKLITHRKLDLESISSFNLTLYGAILAAGYFDGYFSTIIRKGIKGINELKEKNSAYLYPLKIMWEVETAIIWLNENGGYEILEKVDTHELTEKELEMVEKMKENHMRLIATDDSGEMGLTAIGYIVLTRYLNGQTELSLNS